ncbi:uridine nucleosidase [Scheffersomyces amazonensis]|uniref:uridine nucleosidase n=1 Tax=Scheffersomyces amazonensis TaxID=1078765 RepID=UPI00315D760C
MTIQSKIPVWLDCDPGNDDVFAIILALFHPSFKLIGISTVHGNAPLSMTTHNTLALLDIVNVHNIKVYEGSQIPLVNPPKFAAEMHGHTGIGGATFPQVTYNQICQDMSYLEAMKQAIIKYEGNICLICTGTLTNVSKLITAYPEIKSKIKYVSIMGGGIKLGNVTEFAEFNFHTDPHAANHVIQELSSKIILSPLNLTHQVIATKQIRKRIYNARERTRNSSFREIFFGILTFYSEAYARKYGIIDGPPIHDPVAVYSLLPFNDENGEYGYKYLRRKIKVETEGDNEGESIIENDSDDKEGVFIGQKLDVDKFWNEMLDALDVAEKHSKLPSKRLY